MSFPHGAEAKLHFEKLQQMIAKMAVLALEINAKTSLCVFLDISGHVGSYTLEVCKDKEDNYNKKFLEEDVEYQYDYTTGEDGQLDEEDERMFYSRALEKTEYLCTRLEKFLKENNPENQPVKLWG